MLEEVPHEVLATEEDEDRQDKARDILEGQRTSRGREDSED